MCASVFRNVCPGYLSRRCEQIYYSSSWSNLIINQMNRTMPSISEFVYVYVNHGSVPNWCSDLEKAIQTKPKMRRWTNYAFRLKMFKLMNQRWIIWISISLGPFLLHWKQYVPTLMRLGWTISFFGFLLQAANWCWVNALIYVVFFHIHFFHHRSVISRLQRTDECLLFASNSSNPCNELKMGDRKKKK